jgi:hypothetical protein
MVMAALSVPTFVDLRGGDGLEFLLIWPVTFPLGTIALNQLSATGLFSAEIEPLWLRNLLPLAVMTAGGLLQAGLLWLCAKAVVRYWSGRKRSTPGAK